MTKELNQAMGLKIKSQRVKLGMTRKRLAEIVGYDEPRIIYNIEKGLMPVPKSKLSRLMRSLFIDKYDVYTTLLTAYDNYLKSILRIKQ